MKSFDGPFLKADHNLKSLNKVQSIYIAENGEHGQSCHMHGKNGEHLFIRVPVGTVLKDASTLEVVADLHHKKSKFIVCRGGAGGKGNYYFISNYNKAPREVEAGHKGQEAVIRLELKLIADAALVN